MSWCGPTLVCMPDRKSLPLPEFVALMALLMSLAAMSLDAMLPALPDIRVDLNVFPENAIQAVITSMFVGMGFGQMLLGPLSDSYGRKFAVYVGMSIFIFGTVVCIVAESYSIFLFGRGLQGFGASCARVVCVALVRDLYSGKEMARIMSLIMMTFVLVPAIAPAIGQGVLLIAPWPWIFGILLMLAIGSLAWFAVRQCESHPKSKRSRFQVTMIVHAFKETVMHPISRSYTLIAGVVFGTLIGYLTTAQQIYQEIYLTGKQFPLFFGFLAICVGASSYLNSRLVIKLGMRELTLRSIATFFIFALGLLGATLYAKGLPSLLVFMIFMSGIFLCLGMVFGNLNALALEPLGHIAGSATSVISFVQTLISVFLGSLIGHFYDGTLYSFAFGFAFMGAISLGLILATPKNY
jgi:MFS transporter, DHA1 family, multidrug resistance protein